MIKAITVTNDKNEELRIILNNPYTSELAVESIEGLEQEKANVNTTENQVYDGSSFDSAVVPEKPININLIFAPNDGNVERVRHKCYNYFPTTKKVKLEIETDERYLYIEGIVEGNLPEIFSEKEGSAISLICNDPYFKDHTNSKTMLKGVEEAFQFPFSNEDLIDPLLIFGDIYNTNYRNIYYYGEKEAGVEIKIDFSGDLNLLAIYNNKDTNNQQCIYLDLSKVKTVHNISSIVDGDYLIINTTFGNKTVNLYHKTNTGYKRYDALGGVNINILEWILLNSGYNKISFDSDQNNNIYEFMINNNVLYRGV